MKASITRATSKDLKSIADLGGQFIAASISSKFVSYDAEGFKEALHELIAKHIAYVWIARVANKIAGAACLIVTANIYNPVEMLADCYFIDVLPEYRKQGLMVDLLGECEKWCKHNGIVAMTVCFKQEKIAKAMVGKGYTQFETRLIKKIGE